MVGDGLIVSRTVRYSNHTLILPSTMASNPPISPHSPASPISSSSSSRNSRSYPSWPLSNGSGCSPRKSNGSDQNSPRLSDVSGQKISTAPPPPSPPPPPGAVSWRSQSPLQPPPPPSLVTSTFLPLKSAVVEASGNCSENVGEERTSRPKLKPLHWDKVRASSDREMVWDQLRSSSFKMRD